MSLNAPTRSRRTALSALLSSVLASSASLQNDQPPDRRRLKLPPGVEDDPRLPDGKSQKNAIAKAQHEEALKEADRLIELAQSLRKEIQDAGTYVVPVNSLKRTEDIEKLARKIRGRLKS